VLIPLRARSCGQVNHRGVVCVAAYAARDLCPGEEITLRYEDTTDEEFFASLCGHSSH
jgi:hypothetical protein